MKQFLWVGSFLTEDIFRQMVARGYKNAASYVSQKNILEGLEHVSGISFDSVNSISMLGYPGNSCCIIPSCMYSHGQGSCDFLIGYINFLYINKYFMNQRMVSGIKSWLATRHQKNNELHVILYEMRSACLLAAKYIKKYVPQAKIHLIIPDLPHFMDLNMNPVKRVLKNVDIHCMLSHLKWVDDFILYTASMAEYLKLDERSWMLMEGSVNKADINLINQQVILNGQTKYRKKHIILYSGAVDKRFGLDSLVRAMDHLDNSYCLWITGDGPYASELRKCVVNNSRIIYYGFLPKREDLFKLQAQAEIFINLRKSTIQASQYCFPSKLFEYMLWGKPVISTKLKGIPAEYWEYISSIDDLTPACIARVIANVCQTEEAGKKALAGRNFIIQNKNNYAQAQRIYDFITDKRI